MKILGLLHYLIPVASIEAVKAAYLTIVGIFLVDSVLNNVLVVLFVNVLIVVVFVKIQIFFIDKKIATLECDLHTTMGVLY